MAMAGEGTDRELLTQKQYARRRGWSKQYVHQLVKSGRIALESGLIDAAAADAALAQQRDPARDATLASPRVEAATAQGPSVPPESPAPAPGGSFVKARTVREHYRAMREKLEYEQLAGRVISRDDVEDQAFRVGTHVREALLNNVPVIANALAKEFQIDATVLIVRLEDYIRQVLTFVADEMAPEDNPFANHIADSGTRTS
ncbi:MAG: hypothetical protein KIS63_19035 [Caldilineales bacterium]|nr:hypothetical protein [Caldilineales bacterium]